MKEARRRLVPMVLAVVLLLCLVQLGALAQTGGDVYSFGSNYYGQLGLGDWTARLAPTEIVTLSRVKTISAGGYHSLALHERGDVWSCGQRTWGALGSTGIGNCNAPKEISALSAVEAISAGQYHSLVLLENGEVYSFGWNKYGELGLGNIYRHYYPTRIPTLTDVKAIAAGYFFSLVLLENGEVYSFGWNKYGELGLGDTVHRHIPTKIPTLSGVIAISAGYAHSLVLLENGDVCSFGRNTSGQLGLGDTVDRDTPTKIPALSGVQAISAGGGHSLVLLENRDVYSFGRNDCGELGLGDTVHRTTPTEIPTLSGVQAISGGNNHSLVLLENGDVSSFGSNGVGQLGQGDAVDRDIPTKIPTLSGVQAISAGSGHSLVLVGEESAPTAGFTYSPTNPTTEDAIQFTATASDPDGDAITSWYWDFDDGATSTLQNPSHQYVNDGTYTVTLVVTDATGAVGEASQEITIGLTQSATIERPSFLGPEPLHYEFMQGGELILTYVLLDAAGDPLPNVRIELNDDKFAFTNDDALFSIFVDEDDLADFGTPVGSTGYMFQPITSVTGYSIENLPDVYINVLPREWETRWSGGSKGSASVLGLKATQGEGCIISWNQDGELSFGRQFERASGIAASVGASISLTSDLQRGAGLSAEVLFAHAQEDQYLFDNPTDLDQMLAFSGMMLWSAVELGQKASSVTPVGLIVNPVMGFVTDALLNLELPWGNYRTEFGSLAGIKSKSEAVADLQGPVTQTFELLGVPQTVIPWQFLDWGAGAAAELTSEIMVGQTMFPQTDEVEFFLSCESKLDGYVDLPLGLSFPIDALLGGRAAIVLGGDNAVALVCEILTRDGDDAVLDRYSVHLGQDLNANGIDDLVEVIEVHSVMFASAVVDALLSGIAPSQIRFPGSIVEVLWELERASREVGIALEYETICYRDLGDINLDPSVIIGLLGENGLGIELTLQKETVWLKERGVWYDDDKYSTEMYNYDAHLLGDTRTLYDMWLDASGPLRDAIWSGITEGVEYVVEEVAPEIPWELCGAATLVGGLPAGGACVGVAVGTVIASDFVELLGWWPSGVEGRRGELLVLPEPRAPDEPAYWEGVLAVGGFFSFFPQGIDFAPPALLTMTYTDDVIPPGYSESEFDIFAWDAELGRWQSLGAVANLATNTLTAEISTLTTYVVGIDVAPGRPWNLEASVGEASVTLTWNVDDAADLAGFHVYRGVAESGPFERITDAPCMSATYLDHPLEPGDWYYKVTSIDTSGNESGYSSPCTALVGTVCSLASEQLAASGWHMIALPGELCEPCTWTDGEVCGDLPCALDDDIAPFSAYRYEPELGAYAQVPPASEICYQPGMSTWIYTPEENITIDAVVAAINGAVELPLGNGWNQIGNPYAIAISPNAFSIRVGVEEKTLLEAEAAGWISATPYAYDTSVGNYAEILLDTGCLQPWTGVWLRTFVDGCVLVMNPVGCALSGPMSRPLSAAEVQARGLDLPPLPPELDARTLQAEEVLGALTVVNEPNPVRSEHTTVFKVQGAGAEQIDEIRVDIYDQQGLRVFMQMISAKKLVWHTVNNAGELLANGIYLYQVWVKLGEIWYPMEIQKLAVVR